MERLITLSQIMDHHITQKPFVTLSTLPVPLDVQSRMQSRRMQFVATDKRLVKAKESGKWLSLLDWRNTPSEGVGYSPVQRMLCRRTRTFIPTAKSLLKHTIPKSINRRLLEQKSKQAYYYNKGTKVLPEKVIDLVRVMPLKLSEKRTP